MDKVPGCPNVDKKRCDAGKSSLRVQTAFRALTQKLFKDTDPASLGIVRALFGLMMMMDVPHERSLHEVETRFGDEMNCHFPLFDFLQPLPFEYMGLMYFIMWMGSFGICIGYKFHLSCVMFTIPYWYIFLLDKSYWNNHSYLYGLVAFQLLFSSAHHSFSVDGMLDKTIQDQPIPAWNYWIIRFQFFLMYFYAGLKKLDPDWIGGNSMSLAAHWVFDPFRVVLTNDEIDLWIIHRFGFIFDLTVGFFLLHEKTRPLAILFASSFHLMNSRIFSIGQFAYVCLVTTPIFCDYAWPRKLRTWFLKDECKPADNDAKQNKPEKVTDAITLKKKCVAGLLTLYVMLQMFLPYSHSITKGYNNWTNGLYGYSWDMMVHSWDTNLISVTVEDHETGRKHYMDPEAWVRNTRYSRHADMIVQYATCLQRNLATIGKKSKQIELQNISIYMDVWCSLNKRFLQRFIDPRQNLLEAEWLPFKNPSWVLPLLSELTPWRPRILLMYTDVLSWHNFSDSLFVADFHGLTMEHYLQPELENVTLTLLHGAVTVDSDGRKQSLFSGDSMFITSGRFHSVLTTSSSPSTFMYTFINSTATISAPSVNQRRYDIMDGWDLRTKHFMLSLATLYKCFNKLFANFGFNFPF